MLKPEPSARCYLIKPQWSDGGKPRSPIVVALPRTKGFGLDQDPRDTPPPAPEPDKPRRHLGTWRHWRK